MHHHVHVFPKSCFKSHGAKQHESKSLTLCCSEVDSKAGVQSLGDGNHRNDRRIRGHGVRGVGVRVMLEDLTEYPDPIRQVIRALFEGTILTTSQIQGISHHCFDDADDEL